MRARGSMPDSRLPRWGRFVKAVLLLVVGYTMAGLVGVGDLTLPSVVVADVLAHQVPYGPLTTVAAASMGALGVLLHRWRWEWLASSLLAFTLLSRAVATWATLGDEPTRLAPAAGMTMAAGLMALRAVEMWIFACKTGQLAGRRRRQQGET